MGTMKKKDTATERTMTHGIKIKRTWKVKSSTDTKLILRKIVECSSASVIKPKITSATNSSQLSKEKQRLLKQDPNRKRTNKTAEEPAAETPCKIGILLGHEYDKFIKDDLDRELDLIAKDCPVERFQILTHQLQAKRIIYKLQPKLCEIFKKSNRYDKRQILEAHLYLYYNVMEKLTKGRFNFQTDSKNLYFGVEHLVNQWCHHSDEKTSNCKGDQETIKEEMLVQSRMATPNPDMETTKFKETTRKCTNILEKDTLSGEIKIEVLKNGEVPLVKTSSAQQSDFQTPENASYRRKLREAMLKLRSRIHAITKAEKLTAVTPLSSSILPTPLTTSSSSEIVAHVSTKRQQPNQILPDNLVTPSDNITATTRLTTPHCQNILIYSEKDICLGVQQVYLHMKTSLQRFFNEFSINRRKMQKLIRQYVSLRILQEIRDAALLQRISKRSPSGTRKLVSQLKHVQT